MHHPENRFEAAAARQNSTGSFAGKQLNLNEAIPERLDALGLPGWP